MVIYYVALQKVDTLTYNYRIAKLTDKQRALCDFAYFTTAKPREIDKDQVEKLRAVGFNDHEILEASFVVGFFNYTNRWVSSIGVIPNPGHLITIEILNNDNLVSLKMAMLINSTAIF